MKKNKIPIKGGEWVPYVIGYLWFTSLAWWAVMLIIHAVKKDKKFFGPQFHRRVMVSGWVYIVMLVSIVGFLVIAEA
jgi:hypothetical protein